MATRLMMMGTSREDAGTHIAVFCQPEQRDLIQRFVKSDDVKSMCQPSEPGVPSFKVAVIGNAPRLRLQKSFIDVVTDVAHTIPGAQVETLCGVPISFQHRSGQKMNATFGGIIKVLTKDGEIRHYGITAGHALQQFENEIPVTEEVGGAACEPSEPADGQKEKPGLEADDSDEIELDPFMINGPHRLETQTEPESWSFYNPVVLGSIIIHPTDESIPEGLFPRQCYDWALFETAVYEMNKIPTDKKARIVLSKRSPGSTGNRSVFMIGGSHGLRTGQLSSGPSRILVGTGEEFVDAYLMTMDNMPG